MMPLADIVACQLLDVLLCVVLVEQYGSSTLDSIPALDCDVVLVFPLDVETDTLTWLLECMEEHLPALLIDIRYHTTANFYCFYLTECYKE